MELAKRMARLGTETAFEVLVRARELERQGKSVIHLEIGEPDFDTPSNVTLAGVRGLSEGYTHYSPSAGIDALRDAIATDQSRRKGVEARPLNVVVTPGAKPIIFFTLLALVEEGDEVIYPNPGFPIYESVIDFLDAKRVPIGFVERGGRIVWDVDAALEAMHTGTKLLILNSPSNPTGSVIPADDLRRLAEAAVANDVFVLSDEIYSRIVYEGDVASIAAFPGMAERTCILDGFSKTYAMTGWRLGYGVMPEWLAPAVSRLVTNSDSCTATFTQMAGVEALSGPQASVDLMVSEFRARRDLVIQGLNEIPGVRAANPQGAFYAFPNIEGTGMASRELADYLLYDAGVAVLSGTAFGANGEGYIRLSYANSMENLQTALDRMRTAIETRAKVPATSTPVS